MTSSCRPVSLSPVSCCPFALMLSYFWSKLSSVLRYPPAMQKCSCEPDDKPASTVLTANHGSWQIVTFHDLHCWTGYKKQLTSRIYRSRKFLRWYMTDLDTSGTSRYRVTSYGFNVAVSTSLQYIVYLYRCWQTHVLFQSTSTRCGDWLQNVRATEPSKIRSQLMRRKNAFDARFDGLLMS